MIRGLAGRIWRREVSKAELPELERGHAVISTKLFAGRTIARVFTERATEEAGTPPDGELPGLRRVRSHRTVPAPPPPGTSVSVNH